MNQVKVKKLTFTAVMPSYATPGAACFDIATNNGAFEPHPTDVHARIYGTGLAFEIPEDHVMLVFSRSGHGFKDGMRLSNCVGVIDSDYRGELKVSLRIDGIRLSNIVGGDRIAQAMVLPVQQVSFLEVDELTETARGTGGFGSTGV